MKKIFCFLLLALCISFYADAQKRPVMPAEGYWVVETNIAQPKRSTVYFYTNDHMMFYKEEVSGKKINIKRKKIALKLNRVFQEALIAWNRGQVVKENNMLVWNRLH
jgi:hypothetical protein